MRLSRWPLVFLTAFAVLGTSGASGAVKPADAWKKFTPSDGSFTVKFPGVPNKSTVPASQPLGGHITINLYILTFKSNRFMVEDAAVEKGSPGLAAPEAMLSGVEGGMASSMNAKIVSSTKATIQGFPAHRMVLQGKMITKGIVVSAGNHLFTVVVATEAAKLDKATVDKFVNSFKVLKH